MREALSRGAVRPRKLPVQALALPLLYLAGCPDSTSGVELGSYTVVATRTGGTCGAWREEGTYSFAVKLTIRPGVLRWEQANGSPINGAYDLRARSFRVTLEDSAQLAAADVRSGYLGCTMVRHDVIDGLFQGAVPESSTVDAGIPSPPFIGAYTISWSAAPGSDCAQYVGALAQQWAALPCSSSYTLRGARM